MKSRGQAPTAFPDPVAPPAAASTPADGLASAISAIAEAALAVEIQALRSALDGLDTRLEAQRTEAAAGLESLKKSLVALTEHTTRSMGELRDRLERFQEQTKERGEALESLRQVLSTKTENLDGQVATLARSVSEVQDGMRQHALSADRLSVLLGGIASAFAAAPGSPSSGGPDAQRSSAIGEVEEALKRLFR